MPTVVTKTIKPAGGGDYTTLAAWATARARDCVAADVIERAECYGGGNLGPSVVNFASGAWWMDATRYAEIDVASGEAHTGVWDDSKARLVSSTAVAVFANAAGKNYARIRGLQISGNGDTNAVIVGRNTGTGGMLVDGCIITTAHATGYGAFFDTGVMRNCVVYGFRSAPVGALRLCGSGSADNCTVSMCDVGVLSVNGTATVRNCISQNCTDGYNNTFSAASDYNVSDIAGDAPGAHSKTGVVAFKDAAAKDYRLAAADTVARGAGVNLTASGITTDIDGDARPATGAWDIGADQVVESPTPTPGGGRKPWGRDPWGRPAWGSAMCGWRHP